MSLAIPGVMVKPLSQIGSFFTMLGYSFKVFRSDELVDLSDELLRNVKKYAPKNTGLLKSRISATAKKNLIEVRTAVHYAVWVELGVFGKDKTKLIKTPEYGGTILVRSPEGAEQIMNEITSEFGEDISPEQISEVTQFVAAETARRIRNGWAQYMRAGLYDTLPKIITHFRSVLSKKFVRTFEKVDSKPKTIAGEFVKITI